MLYHCCYFRYLQPLKTINVQERKFYIYIFKYLWTFYNIDKFVIGPCETCLRSRHLYLLTYEQGICACLVLNSHAGLEKMSITWKIWNFQHWLKFFDSVCRKETFTCNWNVVLKRSLLFTRDEIYTWFNKLKFRPELKISIQSAP